MAFLDGEKLLQHSFSESELEFLKANEEFIAHWQRVKTIEDYENLCGRAFDLLFAHQKLRSDARTPIAVDFQDPKPERQFG